MEGLKRHSDKYVWERLEGESHESYERFKCYRRLPVGKRSVTKAWKLWCRDNEYVTEELRVVGEGPYSPLTQSGRTPTQWKREFEEYEWESRTLAFDDFQDQLDAESEIELRREIREKRMEAAIELQSRALEALELVDKSRASLSHIASAIRVADTIQADLTEGKSAVQLDLFLMQLPTGMREEFVMALRLATKMERLEDRVVGQIVDGVVNPSEEE